MPDENDYELKKLFKEYEDIFQAFDDFSLARWMAQTIGHLSGGCWRISHPLIMAYKFASSVAQKRQIWHKRLVNFPTGFTESRCCRAPFMPILARDVTEYGLICNHCLETLVPFDELPSGIKKILKDWDDAYSEIHHTAHWDEDMRSLQKDYEKVLLNAKEKAKGLLYKFGREIAPRFLDHYPLIIWEDQDECLGITPEDLVK